MTRLQRIKSKPLTLGALSVLAVLLLGQDTAHSGPPPSGIPVTQPVLNLDSTPSAESAPQAVRMDRKATTPVVLVLLFMTLVLLAAYFFGKRAEASTPYFDPGIFSFSAKLVTTFLVFAYAATHAVAALTVYLDTRVVYASAQEYFFYIKPARLAALTHAHLMAIATMDGLVALLYTLTRRSNGFTAAVVTATFLGIFGDIASWWTIKYLGDGYEPLSMVSGLLFSGGFLVMSVEFLRSIWLGSSKRSTT